MYRLSILCFCFLGVSALTKIQELFQAEASKKSVDCISEVGASDDDMKGIINQITPTSREGMCLITCIHERFGIQDSDGKLNRGETLEFLKPLKALDPDHYEATVQHFEECLTIVSSNDEKCTIGANFMRCLVEEGKTKGIFE